MNDTLENYCSIHTGFYPEGYNFYTTYCFLFSSDHESTINSFFGSFPTTPFIMEVDNQLLVFSSVTSTDIMMKLFCTIYDMKEAIIDRFQQAVALFYY